MSELRKIIKFSDPGARLLREQRRLRRTEDNRDVVIVSLAVMALLSFVAAVAGWWLYLAGKGCAAGAA